MSDRAGSGDGWPPPTAAPTGVETLAFDSDEPSPDPGFERYRRFYARGADAEQTGPDFHARVTALRLDRINIFSRHLNDVAHTRSADRVAIDGFDHVTVTLVLSGGFEIDTGKGWRPIPPGCGVVADTLAPMRNRSRHAHIVTLSIARGRFVGAIGATEGMHGRFIGAGEAALLIDFVTVLLRRLDTLGDATAVPAAHALVTLIAAAVGAAGDAADPSAVAIRDAIRIGRVRTLVDANIADPNFDADQVIARAGVARATLYRAFRAQGGIAGYIRARRLEALRVALGDAANDRSFAQLAFDVGLKSEAHASRLFLERFGMRPGEYRAAMTSMNPGDDAVRQMVRWQENLRDGGGEGDLIRDIIRAGDPLDRVSHVIRAGMEPAS